MKEYFTMVDCHKNALDERLQSKFGEYADSNVNTISTKDGGYITLSFGIYDIREELVNFSKEVSDILNSNKLYSEHDLTESDVRKSIESLIGLNNINLDLDWEEESEDNKIVLFYNDRDYREMVVENEYDKWRFDIMDSLYQSINEFINSTMDEAIKSFNEAWVYNYSSCVNVEE